MITRPTPEQLEEKIIATVDSTMDRIGMRKIDIQTREILKVFTTSGVQAGVTLQAEYMSDMLQFLGSIANDIHSNNYELNDEIKEKIKHFIVLMDEEGGKNNEKNNA